MASGLEIAYPFYSMSEFFLKGCAFNPRGYHLDFGLLLLIILSVRVFMSRQSILGKFTTLYFSTFIFNNPAYKIFNLQFNEYMGIAGCVCLFYEFFKKPVLLKRDYRESIVGYSILAVTLVFALHAIVLIIIGVQPLYYDGLESIAIRVSWLRIMVIGKIVVLGLMIISADLTFCNSELWNRLIRTLIGFGLAAASVYIIQLIVCYGVGLLPYGSWWDAGGVNIRSFGGVSIERGHFSKFFVPFFPFFLWGVLKEKKFFSFIIYLLISSVNFSSSGQAFLLVYIVLTIFVFRKSITSIQVYAGLGIVILLSLFFHDAYLGVLTKIWDYGFLGGEKLGTVAASGRSPQVLFSYLKAYPWGLSYGGSTLRCVAGLLANNMGLFVFLTQLSFLAIPIIIGFLFLIRFVIKRARGYADYLSYKVFLIGSIVPVFIYCVDVLWFIPHIWLPLVILNNLKKYPQSEKQ